jgi:hypothetical protein
LKAIKQGTSIKEISVAECSEKDRYIDYWGKKYVPDSPGLQLRLMKKYNYTALAGLLGSAMKFDLLGRQYFLEIMRKQID